MASDNLLTSPTPAAALAQRIAADIAASSAAPGEVVASAQALRALSDAGRPVFQQAVRILEERGVAYMRRGAGGGLVVASPSPDFPARALSIVIEHDIETIQEQGPLPLAIDSHLYLDAAPRLDWAACESLRRLIQRLDRLPSDEFLRTGAHRQLRTAVRTITGHPMAMLANQTSMECEFDIVPYQVGVARESKGSDAWLANLDLAEALIAGDPEKLFAARSRLVSSYEASWDGWAALERDPGMAPRIGDQSIPEFQLPGNRADRLVREILREIRLLDWTVGARIGSGVELMERYGVGADILRQAVLLLQEHSAVRAERGRRGGLYVSAPDRGRAVAGAQAYLQRSDARPADVQAFLLHLALHALEGFPRLDLDRLKRNGRAAADAMAAGGQEPVSLWEAVAGLCRNPVFSLFAEVTGPLLPPILVDGANAARMAQAAAAGDLAQARRLILSAAQRTVTTTLPRT